LLCDEDGTPISPVMFYHEPASARAGDALVHCLPDDGGEVPPTLGRVVDLWAQARPNRFHVVHQADWIAGLFCGRFDFSDENNALKLGHDPSAGCWIFDAAALPFDATALPRVFPPATAMGSVTPAMSAQYGLSPACRVFTGTTDGMAGFIAASGLDNLQSGTAVTSLGTTMVVKAVSPNRVDVSKNGIYSHRLFQNWVAGGASNTGGGALLRHFSASEIEALSARIDPGIPSGLNYYPLVAKGERFPIADPELPDRSEPRPDDRVAFLAGLLESIARIEKAGFDLMRAHGVPYPVLVKTVGGGSQNQVWLKIRQRILGVPVVRAENAEAAFGAALIALRGGRNT
jgi:hypothetical protein